MEHTDIDTEPFDPRAPQPGSLAAVDNVLGDGKSWVELQDMMPHPGAGHQADLAVVNAARVSFLGHSKGPEADKKLLMYLLRHRHTSPFEQVEFKFRVRAPVVVWWQWVRHRTFHYNFQSGRYTPFEEHDAYVPQQWRQQSASNKQGSAGVIAAKQQAYFSTAYDQINQQAFALYSAALEAGIAREQARLFLPGWASYYIAVVKVDAWNLMHFLRLRTAPDAQWEIRMYANALHTIFTQMMPWSAEAYERYLQVPDQEQS